MEERTAARRTRRGLTIEGVAAPRTPGAPRRAPFTPGLAGLDLSARAQTRPVQSLLDDALRLAREHPLLGRGGLARLTSS